MKKLKIVKIDNYDYTFVNSNGKNYTLNIEFYCEYKPSIGDIIYFPDDLLKEVNLFAFGDIYDDPNMEETDMIKVVSGDRQYYLQRYYG